MKKITAVIVVLIFVCFSTVKVFAQPGKNMMIKNERDVVVQKGPGCGMMMCIPNLTEDQKAKISKLHATHKKEMMLAKAITKEKEAHLKVLMLAETPDMVAINKTIDEIGASKADAMKKKVAFQMEVRKLLTEEQKLAFDQCIAEKGGKCGKGEKKMMMKKIIKIEDEDMNMEKGSPCKGGMKEGGCKEMKGACGHGMPSGGGEGCKGGR
ncbi:MAG: periplasmic heavy metal sensor [Bacteroidota bacterium]